MKHLKKIHKDELNDWDGTGIISFCNNPVSVGYTTVKQENERNYNSTEFWCAMQILDDLKVPRKEISTGEPYSIVGRIMWLSKRVQLVVGNYYYYGKYKTKFKCIEVGKEQSKFLNSNNDEFQFYNDDMYYNEQ